VSKDDLPIRIAIAGLGTAGLAFIPAIKTDTRFQLVAFAEPDLVTGASLAVLHGVRAYAAIEELNVQADIDAIVIATPTPLHMAHATSALSAGKHVILEKPMATNIADALAMAQTAEANKCILIIGHSHSFDLPVQHMRALIAGGKLGRVRMINSWNFTDWIYRPRRPDELDENSGGGVTLRQGSHQFDIIRLLAGGALRTVRAQTFKWDSKRQAIGAHTAFLEFADGVVATAVYSGYGGVGGAELISGVSEWGYPEPITVPSTRVTPADFAQAKRRRAKESVKSAPPFQAHFGLTVVNCEGGDIRQSPSGLLVYSPEGRQEITLPAEMTPHRMVVAEFADGIMGVTEPLHDARWGAANLETCLAAIESAKTGKTVSLRHQISLDAGAL
jgi:phthalate 4,5-cis-dihydrodiol dehydrogenase